MRPSSVTLGVAALSAASLLFETSLTRLLAVAQFYHFAFLIVSLALIGYGASGTFLSLARHDEARPHWLADVEQLLVRTGLGFIASCGLAYAAVNLLPFDSYRIAFEPRQLLYFVLYYLALATPFFAAGLGVGAALAESSGRSHRIYAANLAGSAAGVAIAPLTLELAGVPGAVLASGLIAMLPAIQSATRNGRRWTRWAAGAPFLAGILVFGYLSGVNAQGRAPLALNSSPYKGLPQALHYPGAHVIYARWNAISRVDVLAGASTHVFPGLSYQHTGTVPPQSVLFVDGDAPLPVTLSSPDGLTAARFLPEALAFSLRPGGRTLVIEPGGGLGILQALAGGAGEVTALVSNPLLRKAVTATSASYDPYGLSGVHVVSEPARTYLAHTTNRYDLVFIPLTDAYRPVTNGAYSLIETYNLTVEAFDAALERLSPHGILVVTRWFQTPPSEDLRILATLIEALKERGAANPQDALVAYRGIQTVTSLVQPDGWAPGELVEVRAFLDHMHYDLVWAPDVREEEVNRYNHLPEPSLYLALKALSSTHDAGEFYATQPFDVRPVADDRPFFFHFFTWRQTPQVVASMGHTWQPFGGSGYFILLGLLALVLVLSAALILAPLLGRRPTQAGKDARHPAGTTRRVRLQILIYFSLLGLAFLLVEIPLIQRAILLLGNPTYAFTAVLLALLLFSSLGSRLARAPWLRRKAALGLLAMLALGMPFLSAWLVEVILGWPLAARVALLSLGIAPLAVLMGLPFPFGLAWLEERAPGLVPWAWAVNGCASVAASVLAAILALSYGLTAVMLLGGVAYLAAGAVIIRRL
jgi:hypothetical protein